MFADRKKKLSRSSLKKKKELAKMGWFWLALVAAALLFVGASSDRSQQP